MLNHENILDKCIVLFTKFCITRENKNIYSYLPILKISN